MHCNVLRHAVVVAFLLMLPQAATQAQVISEAAGRVEALSGGLAVKRVGGQLRPLQRGDSVAVGDEILTGRDSRLSIRRADGSTVEVFPDTRILFRNRASGFAEFLHLFLGQVKVHIERISGRPNDHQMTTPTAVIAVRGTIFSVFVDGTEATIVAVDEGLVSVAGVGLPGNGVLLRAGQRSQVRRGEAPEAPRQFRGASDREGVARGDGAGANQGPGAGATPGEGGRPGAPGGARGGRGGRRP